MLSEDADRKMPEHGVERVVVLGRKMRDNFAKRGPDRLKESDNFIVPKSAIEAIDAQGAPNKEDGSKDEHLL